MKWGGRDEISTFKAIIGLLVIAMICICICFVLEFASQGFRSLKLFLIGVYVACIVCSFVLWQSELNLVFKQSRSDSESAKTIWNIFQIGFADTEQKEEEKEKQHEKKTV